MKIVLLFFVFIFTYITSFSQRSQETLPLMQVDGAIGLYNKYTGGNAPLYNGPEYIFYTFKMVGDPFFHYTVRSKESISYLGRRYFPISILYDIARDQVVILRPDSTTRIVLHNEFVDSFTLAGHTFIRLSSDLASNLYQTGFYDVLYEGKIRLLARRIKLRSSSPGDNRMIEEFYEKDRYYVHQNGVFYQVDNPKDVYKLFAGNKREIKKMLRNQHLRFRHKGFEGSLIKVIALVDQLNQIHE